MNNQDREDRMVASVLTRIAAAPPRRARAPGLLESFSRMAVPALAAAAAVIITSVALIKRENESTRGPATVADALGVAPPLARYVATREVDPWGWINRAGDLR